MGRAPCRRLSAPERERVLALAKEMFADGHSAVDVCRRTGVTYSTLRHLCIKAQIVIPKSRGF